MIDGIWDNEYILELGIKDHCTEVLVLTDRLRIAKAEENTEKAETVRRKLDGEMMDLHLMLDKWVSNRSGLKIKRLNRFIEKARENEDGGESAKDSEDSF